MISVLINPARHSPVQKDKVHRIVTSFLKRQKIGEVVVSLRFVDRQEMRQLNKRYRSLDKPTTVLT
ncbi:hypothetical protein AMJ51_02595, partial [Microgenomates bacterium DG_75]